MLGERDGGHLLVTDQAKAQAYLHRRVCLADGDSGGCGSSLNQRLPVLPQTLEARCMRVVADKVQHGGWCVHAASLLASSSNSRFRNSMRTISAGIGWMVSGAGVIPSKHSQLSGCTGIKSRRSVASMIRSACLMLGCSADPMPNRWQIAW